MLSQRVEYTTSLLASMDANTTVLGLIVAYALYRAYVFFTGLKVSYASVLYHLTVCNQTHTQTVSYLPGIRCVVEPFTLIGAITPESWWHPGLNFQWSQRLTCESFPPPAHI